MSQGCPVMNEQSCSKRGRSLTHRGHRYQLRDLAGAISSFEASIAHTPPEIKPSFPDPDAPTPELTPAQAILADTHTNLGAAYILSQPPNAEKALEHLQKALMMNPDDGEVCYNLAAVLEATGQLDDALVAYERSIKLGIERAAVNVRNVSAHDHFSLCFFCISCDPPAEIRRQLRCNTLFKSGLD